MPIRLEIWFYKIGWVILWRLKSGQTGARASYSTGRRARTCSARGAWATGLLKMKMNFSLNYRFFLHLCVQRTLFVRANWTGIII